MPGPSIEDLVLFVLAGAGEGGEHAGEGYTILDLTDALGLSWDRLSDQIELASTLEALRERGLVTIQAPDGDLRSDCVRFISSECDGDRIGAIQEQLAKTTVEVVTGTRENLTIEEAAALFGRSQVEIAANLTDDGVYYPEDSSSREFFGHEDSLERCSGLVEAVRGGTGRAVFLVGPAGVGKTTVAERLLERAADDGFEVLRGRCRSGGTTPYQPLRDALADIGEPSPFTDVGPGVDDAETFEAQQTALFSTVTDRLVGDDARPRLLYLDDLHLADAATLAYLEYLLARLADRTIGLLGSYRPQDLSENAPVGSPTIPGDAPVAHVEVQPFDREQTRASIGGVLGRRDLPEAFVDTIYERTGGNPMFIEETVTAMLEAGDLQPDLDWYPERTEDIEMPPKVRETIDRRVEGFPRPAQDLLEWVAVLGDQFPESIIEWVSDLSSTQSRTYVDLFVHGAILERTEQGMLQFRSGVVREALLERLPSDERRERHDTVASALEANLPDSDDREAGQVGAIAHHHDRAGNSTEAIEWHRRAAEQATDVYAHEVAIDHYEQAIALAKRTDDDEAILEIVEALASIHVTTGNYDEAERHVEFARRGASTTHRRQRLLHLASRIATERGNYDGAIELADEGLALDEATTRPRCLLLQQKALAQLEQGAYEPARQTVERLRETAQELADARLEGNAYAALGWAAYGQSDHEAARTYLQRAVEILGDVGDRHGVAEAHVRLGDSALEQSDYDGASVHFQRAQDIFEDVGNRHAVAKVIHQRGLLAWQQSDYEAAREYYGRALETFREVGDRHGIAKVHNDRGLLAWEQSDYEDAREYYWRALDIFRDVGAQQDLSNALNNLGQISWEQGDYEDAREYFQRTLDLDLNRGDSYGAAVCLNNIGTVAREQGAFDEAERYLERGLDQFRAVGDRHAVGKALNNLGLLARDRQDFEAADEYYRRALEIFYDVEDSHDVARVRSNLGEIATKRGSYGEARDHFEHALDGLRDVGDRHNEARCLVRFGKLARDRGDVGSGRQRGEQALSILEEVATTEETLEAFELIVDCARQDGDIEEALSWCRRALAFLSEREDVDGDEHDEQRQWFEAQRVDLERTTR